MATWKKIITSGSSAELSSLTLDTALPVAQGGTGATTLTDGGILLGSGTGAITATAVLTDGQILVGDGTGDPVAESGATLRTSIGVGTGDNVQFTNITGTGNTTLGNATADTHTITGHITASGNISASGTITMLTASIGGGTFTSASLASAIAGTGDFENFTVTADGGSDQTITNGNTLDIAGGTNITTAVGTTDTVTINLDNEIINASLKAGRDSNNLIDFATTNNKIIFRVNNINQVSLLDNVLGPEADSDVDLGTTAKRFKDAFVDSVTVTDNVTIGGNLTVNGTTTTIATTNTEVTDQFIFLASGSTDSATDGGIIVSHGGSHSGSAFVYDASANRWGFPLSGSTGKTDTSVSPEGYVSAVVTDDNEPTFRKNGNIRVDSGEIYIYVE